MQAPPNAPTRPDDFWEAHYLTKRTAASGRPSMLLVRYAQDLPAGTALDIGCAHGDDAVWLAGRGWQVTGVDISKTVIERARQRAQAAALGDKVRFIQHDLAHGLPAGSFDLVTACYFQSPVALPRADILRAAVSAVAPGGHLLIVAHASGPPWGKAPSDTRFVTAKEDLDALALAATDWTIRVAEEVERQATGADGQTATLMDAVLFLKKALPARSSPGMATPIEARP